MKRVATLCHFLRTGRNPIWALRRRSFVVVSVECSRATFFDRTRARRLTSAGCDVNRRAAAGCATVEAAEQSDRVAGPFIRRRHGAVVVAQRFRPGRPGVRRAPQARLVRRRPQVRLDWYRRLRLDSHVAAHHVSTALAAPSRSIPLSRTLLFRSRPFLAGPNRHAVPRRTDTWSGWST